MSRELRGRSRHTKPIPPTYANIKETGKWDTKDITYTLTPEQLQEVYNQYGPPIARLGTRQRDMGKHRQSGKKVKA